jgi:hypothetical protein
MPVFGAPFVSEKWAEGLGRCRTNTRIACMHVHDPRLSNKQTQSPASHQHHLRTYRPRSVLGLSDDLRYACFLLLPLLLLFASSSSSREDTPLRKRLHPGVSSTISPPPTSDLSAQQHFHRISPSSRYRSPGTTHPQSSALIHRTLNSNPSLAPRVAT